MPEGLDCQKIMSDPGTAMERVAQAVGHDPAKIWDGLERCAAPGGDLCARVAAGAQMVPSMAASDGVIPDDHWARYAEACRTLPEAQQRCLLVSYGVEHMKACEASGAKRALRAAMDH